MPSPARSVALGVLGDVDRGMRLAERLARRDVEALDPRERAFLHELVLGTLRTRGALDHALSSLSDRPLAELDPVVMAVLRLGAYQLLRTRVPARAAVSESVELLRAASPRATGYANAVLRRLSREGPPAAPDPQARPLEWLTTSGSLPRWLAERWLANLGTKRTLARARALLEPPLVAFRFNPRHADVRPRVEAAGVRFRPLAVPGAFEAVDGGLNALAAQGLVYVQDQGSQMVAHLAARPDGLLLDACAAPGGKATLLSDLSPTGRVVACEIAPSRLVPLAAHVRRWGASNVRVVGGDSRHPPLTVGFDTILLDAPCSGLGTLSRHPDIRWKSRATDLPRHAQRQHELLEGVAPLLARGGTLVYATCSVEAEENEGVLQPFLDGHAELRPAPLPTWAAAFADGAFARTTPERDRGDAFFAAALTRD